MAQIMKVNYEELPNYAKKMREEGKKLNNEIKKAYASIDNMHNSWYGKRYNELVSAFNELIPQINEILELVVGQIPFTIETVANNYAQVDTGNKITSAVNEEPSKITNLNIHNDVGMRFITEEVTNIQKSVSDSFKNAKTNMDSIDGIYKNIVWNSEASQAFQERFNKLKASIIASFDNINSQFITLMNKTKEDIQSTENANTVK